MDRRESNYKHDSSLNNASSQQTRSSRNANLYREVYGKYDTNDNLPLEDNTQKIDMVKLRELVSSSKSSNIPKKEEVIKEDLNILEQRKRRIDEQKLYDINEILEKAKYENSKLKDNRKPTLKPRKDLLATLESTELSLDDINEAKRIYEETTIKDGIEEKLTITREIKIKDIEEVKNKDDNISMMDTNSLSLDLFEDLKPTENTITTKPINEEEVEIKKVISTIKSDIHSSDTTDIDIIKNTSINSNNDFFTSSYNFSESDFADSEDDFFDKPKKGGFFKTFFLCFVIIALIAVIVYFVINDGLGI